MAQILQPRQIDILEIARRDGRVEVDSLAAHFDVTPQTIRKDLNELCDLEKLQRVHGGAVFPSNTVNVAYQARRDMASEGKARIAAAAAEIVPNNSSVILNIGTTTEQVAHALRRHSGLMAITNNLNVAFILSEAEDVEVVITGGMVRKSDRGIIGAAAVDLIRQFKVDFAIIGASAIDASGELLDFDYREVRVAQAIIEQSRRKILVADHMKFQRRAPVQIGQLADIDYFVTDAAPPKSIMQICREANVELIVAT
ncbi:DeoR/GlpR family DNA-binding transcription regulator [Hoeflea prorocentri]|uniref:DeoR family transcriptional regulator n=1 Tax=Hoeflea prorocentri TaxID=1922333 RepID=A0A9X3ZI93_9HYPH|nr:DeoR family transcriptional regulator [Hoeflea prorocentri]MCY6382692.1 DeoR family transcriptional regulator [Hoeflea prorocentri]MDA5400492.1 DeoR family transcriptional regulator [Hoeflea prorocentri]